MAGDAGFSDGALGLTVSCLKVAGAIPLTLAFALRKLVMAFCPSRYLRRDVTGNVVLITGGSSGIGREMAVRFAKMGCDVIIWGRYRQTLEETCRMAKTAGGSCKFYVVDVTDRTAVYSAAEKILKQYKRVDILINNAGVVYGKDLLDSKDEEIINTFNVNTISHFFITKAFLPGMLERDSGHIVTVSSMGGMQPVNKMTDYCASKAAARQFHDTLKTELWVNGHRNIRLTLILPFYFDSGMFAGIYSSFIPIMTMKHVVDASMDAILTGTSCLMLPKYIMPVLMFVKAVCDERMLFTFMRAMGLDKSLDHFRGRQAGTESSPRFQISG